MKRLLVLVLGSLAAASFLDVSKGISYGNRGLSQGSESLRYFAERSLDLAPRDTTGTCSDSTPCSNGACCSVSGYCGYSPAFCGTGNCTSNCDAKAECGEYALEENQNCPLNVCCSQYGFCGTTSDFCGTGCQTGYGGTCGSVTEPSCSGITAQQRIIGYYESWSLERVCDTVAPEDLNLAGFTHVNMAFAYFDPGTFAITSMDATMQSLLNRFTALKSTYSGLQTWISVGGWSFSDPGSTQEAWSTMAASSVNREAFISSLVQFMKTYGFDGVDLDWEYPGAADRGGSSDDGANFVQLLKDMRSAFGDAYGISATLPTSYWYLQGFNPVDMEPYLDWFNLMAYDLHGVWDATDIYTGPYIEPHTNLTEISEATDLLWRAGVTPGKVVLGQGWYGRSFTLADPSCNTPNGICEFTAGGNPGACTATSGILSNAEIQQIITQYDVTPVYDEVDAVNWITWNTNQWVSYDDATTYAQKLSFANDLCLGGMMVWAVDLNNQSTKTGYGTQADTGLSDTATNYTSQLSVNTQAGMACYTSQCGVDCMPGYSGVTNMNGQPGYLPTADVCSGDDVETLCCASGTKLGTCTWRGWRGQGLPCSGGCNPGETLVAQNTNHHDTVNGVLQDQTCNGGLQNYCCSDFVAPSTLQTSTSEELSEDDLSSNPIVSLVVATVTEAIANAAKSVIDAVATDFCEVAVPAFLAPIEDIELAIPIFGEIAIAVEDGLEPEIVKGCEKLIEDGGDAVLSWLGFTSTYSVTDITETVTSTATEDPLCEPNSCSGSCSKKKRSLRAPARQPDPRVTDTPMISPRAIPTTPDPTWGYLDKPTTGGLDDFATHFFNSDPTLVFLDRSLDVPYYSTSIYVPFGNAALFAGVMGLEGCTSVVLVSRCGAYMTHMWEPSFRMAASTSNPDATEFNDLVLVPLKSGSAYMSGISQLPDGCFTSAENVQAMVYSRTFSGTPKAYYPTQVAEIQAVISNQLGIDATLIDIQYYNAVPSDANDEDSANGKIMLTYDPNVFNDGTRAAFQVWSGQLLLNGAIVTDNSQINTPMLSDYWTPDFNDKRDTQGYTNYFNMTGWLQYL